MQDNHNSLSPQPQVTVQPIRRTDPVVDEALAEIKKLVEEDGFCNIKEYLECSQRHGVSDEVLLPLLQASGYGFVKTAAVNRELPQEVIIDLRFIAAAMLLVYNDKSFASKNSVYKTLEVLHQMAGSDHAFVMCGLAELLHDAYATYGHHFTVMEVADSADLTQEDEHEILAFAKRHISALNELSKSDAELTAVYHLCMNTMLIVNHQLFEPENAPTYRHFDDVLAYGYFWRKSCQLRDRARTKLHALIGCGNPQCNHQHH